MSPSRSTIPTGHAPGEFVAALVGGTSAATRRAYVSTAAAASEPKRYLVALAFDVETSPGAGRLALAYHLQNEAPNVDGSITAQLGFGAWGVEEGVQILSTTVYGGELLAAVASFLAIEEQTCAYVEIDGEALELTPAGELNPIQGYAAQQTAAEANRKEEI
jgi:hypothetical protein